MIKFLFCTLVTVALTFSQEKYPVLKVGHAGHDHQTALYVACLHAEKTKKDCGIYLKEVDPQKHYEMIKGDKKIADIEIILGGGGSRIPAAMAQNTIEIGIGGVAAFAYFVDKGSSLKIISPLHMNGDMLVVKKENTATSWDTYVKWLQSVDHQVKIGYKEPVAVAKMIFERALKEAGIPYTGDASSKDAKVLMVDMKGAENIIPGMKNNLIDGFVCNNPVCANAEFKGAGKVIADLNVLPPGIFKDHPCCAIAATDKVLTEKRAVVNDFMKLIILSTNYINKEKETVAVQSASKWLGTDLEVEKLSIPTSLFSTQPNEQWKKGMYVWIDAMHEMNQFKDKLKDKKGKDVDNILFDFSLLNESVKELNEKKISEWF